LFFNIYICSCLGNHQNKSFSKHFKRQAFLFAFAKMAFFLFFAPAGKVPIKYNINPFSLDRFALLYLYSAHTKKNCCQNSYINIRRITMKFGQEVLINSIKKKEVGNEVR